MLCPPLELEAAAVLGHQLRTTQLHVVVAREHNPNQYHSWFYFKPPPHNFKMLNYLKKEKDNIYRTFSVGQDAAVHTL